MDVFASAAMGKEDQLRALLENDPDLVNARFKSVRTGPQDTNVNDWATPLWFAVMNGRLESVRFLTSRGADPEVHDESGKAIVEYAREAGHDGIVKVLSG